jgi:hypothetical protein
MSEAFAQSGARNDTQNYLTSRTLRKEAQDRLACEVLTKLYCHSENLNVLM